MYAIANRLCLRIRTVGILCYPLCPLSRSAHLPTMTMTAVEQSPQDDRCYRHVVLPNGLSALLISDPTTDKASAALDVRVGHLSDPDCAPGLAHFLEHVSCGAVLKTMMSCKFNFVVCMRILNLISAHPTHISHPTHTCPQPIQHYTRHMQMLFLGTEKFPDENEYNQYLNKHGGSSNAYTDMEWTNYYFDCSADHLEGALDRFSQFFIAPCSLRRPPIGNSTRSTPNTKRICRTTCGDRSSCPRRFAGRTIPFTSLVPAIRKRWGRDPRRRASISVRNCWDFTKGTIRPTS